VRALGAVQRVYIVARWSHPRHGIRPGRLCTTAPRPVGSRRMVESPKPSRTYPEGGLELYSRGASDRVNAAEAVEDAVVGAATGDHDPVGDTLARPFLGREIRGATEAPSSCADVQAGTRLERPGSEGIFALAGVVPWEVGDDVPVGPVATQGGRRGAPEGMDPPEGVHRVASVGGGHNPPDNRPARPVPGPGVRGRLVEKMQPSAARPRSSAVRRPPDHLLCDPHAARRL
jgi:hypothetical protein